MNIKLKTFRNRLFSKLDGMIVTNPVNVKYLTGLKEEGILVVGEKENIFITDSRYIESVNKNLTIDDQIVAYDVKDLSKYDYEGIFMISQNVGFEEKYVTYADYKKYLQLYKVDLQETEDLIENQRVTKEPDEIECITKACEITDKAFEYICENIKEGMTEKQIAFLIEKFMVDNGADGIAFDLIVASGPNSSMPHAIPTDRKLESGDIIQFDIGCRVEGYCSDMSRVTFVDFVKDEYKEIYDFVSNVQKQIAIRFKEGANIKPVIKDIETEYKLKGYNIMHSFGHGVGLDIHEIPYLRSAVDCNLKENAVITIEPGVYFKNEFGIRIEDTYLVKKGEVMPLTNSRKDYVIIKLKKEVENNNNNNNVNHNHNQNNNYKHNFNKHRR